MYERLPTIYIGYDEREDIAFEVLVESIKSTSSFKNLNIIKLNQSALRAIGLYRRAYKTIDNKQKIDLSDGLPFSTDFSFTRFLVPHLNQYEGLAIYMDCDMLVRSDIMEVFEKYAEAKHAVSCIWHDYVVSDNVIFKMDQQIQQNYSKKNWSSFMLWNCGHPANANLTPDDVNTKPGRWLHNFEWIGETINPIGSIHEEWNWLDGHSNSEIEAKNVHFTTGGPWFSNWTPLTTNENEYVDEWKALRDKIIIDEGLVNV